MNRFLRTIKEVISPDAMTARDLETKIREDYFGQDKAVRIACTAVVNHYNRIDNPEAEEIRSSHILMPGPTGSGKTHLARRIADAMDVPFFETDISQYSQTGYVGGSVNDIFKMLLMNAGGDEAKAQRGIVFLDEFDKIAANSGSSGPDVRGKGLQEELLRLLGGSKIMLELGQGYEQQTIPFDTSDVLFICGGAFSNMMVDINAELANSKKRGIGFNGCACEEQEERFLYSDLTQEMVIKYGRLLPELVGRCPVIAPLEHLEKGILKRILLDGRNSPIRRAKVDLATHNITAQFGKDAIEHIIETAVSRNIGARGLNSCDELLLDYQYDLQTLGPRTVRFTKDMFVNPEKHKVKYAKENTKKSEVVLSERVLTLIPHPSEEIVQDSNSTRYGFTIIATYGKVRKKDVRTSVNFKYRPNRREASMSFYPQALDGDEPYEVEITLLDNDDHLFDQNGIRVIGDENMTLTHKQTKSIIKEFKTIAKKMKTYELIDSFDEACEKKCKCAIKEYV